MEQKPKPNAAIKTSNSRHIVCSNNRVSGRALVETDGFVDDLVLDGNTVESYADATVLYSNGALTNAKLTNNKLRKLDTENNMSEAKCIKAAGTIENCEVNTNEITGFENVTLIESDSDVIDTKVNNNKIVHPEAQKLLLELQAAADNLELVDSTRTELNNHIGYMDSTIGSGSFLQAYIDFSTFVNAHTTVLGPLLPFVPQLVQYLNM